MATIKDPEIKKRKIIKPKIPLFKRYVNFVSNGITRSAPVQVTLFITSRCNIRCKMCFYWEPVESKSSDEITLDELEKISLGMKPFFWLLVGGGEPFVRKDLYKIVEIFYKNNGIRHVSIPTNATYPDQIIIQLEKILEDCPDLFLNLNLSLNGLGTTHDELCQVEGVFDKFLVTYKRLAELKKRFKNLGIGLNMTHSKYTQDELDKIIDFAVSDLPAVDNISLGLVRGRPKEKSSLNVDINYYKKAVQKIESYAVQNKLRTFNTVLGGIAFTKDMIMRRIIANTSKLGYQIPCLAGKISLVIDEKTNVYPCEMLSKVGNLRDSDYKMENILKGETLRTAIKKIKEENCYCTHECSYSTNVLFSYRMWFVIARRYIEFRLKQFFKSKKLFKDFDSLTLPASNSDHQFDGQQNSLYDGRTFGITTDEEKTHKPAKTF